MISRLRSTVPPAGQPSQVTLCLSGFFGPPLAVPGWFGAEDQGAGIAIADINGSGRQDLVIFHVDNPGGENHGYYRIGKDLNRR